MAKKKVNTESQGNAALNMMAQMMASMQGGNAPDSIPAPNVPVETPPVPAAAIGLQSQVVDRLKAEIADLEAELKGIGKPTKRHAKELRDELKAELENRKKVLKQMSGAGSAGGSKPGEGGKAQSKRGKSGKASDTPVHFNREDRVYSAKSAIFRGGRAPYQPFSGRTAGTEPGRYDLALSWGRTCAVVGTDSESPRASEDGRDTGWRPSGACESIRQSRTV